MERHAAIVQYFHGFHGRAAEDEFQGVIETAHVEVVNRVFDLGIGFFAIPHIRVFIDDEQDFPRRGLLLQIGKDFVQGNEMEKTITHLLFNETFDSGQVIGISRIGALEGNDHPIEVLMAMENKL